MSVDVPRTGDSIPYDTGSIMHYGPTAFSMFGDNTLETIDPNQQMTIGQRAGLSFNDVRLVNAMYCKETCPSNGLACANGGYVEPNDCRTCKCPTAFGGQLCDGVETSSG